MDHLNSNKYNLYGVKNGILGGAWGNSYLNGVRGYIVYIVDNVISNKYYIGATRSTTSSSFTSIIIINTSRTNFIILYPIHTHSNIWKIIHI